MTEITRELINYGVLGIFACAFMWALWRVATFLGHRLFDESNGLVTLYLAKQSEFLDGLAKRDEQQQELCDKHATCLNSLVELHKDPDGPTSTVKCNAELATLKAAARQHVEMCRIVVGRELPNSAAEVNRHLDAMEQILES